MKYFFTFLLAITMGAIGLTLGFAIEAPLWRIVLSALSGMAGGVGIASSLLHIHQLNRR